MARSKKVTPVPQVEALPSPPAKATYGFYKRNGDTLHFAPTAVHYPGGSLLASNHAEYTYPVEGWTYYESAEAAYAAEGLEMLVPKEKQTRINMAEKISARRAMTPEEKEAERNQRVAERIARLEKTHPERAAQLKTRAEQRKERMAQMGEIRAMSPEQRRETQLAKLQRKNPDLAAKIRAREASKV